MRESYTNNDQKPPSFGNNHKGLFQFSAVFRVLIVSPLGEIDTVGFI